MALIDKAAEKFERRVREAAETGAYELGIQLFTGRSPNPNIVEKWKKKVTVSGIGQRWKEGYLAKMTA